MHATPDVNEMDNVAMPGASRFGRTVDAIRDAPLACADDGLSAFMGARPRLFGIAYRMLGNAAEAEDIVQDVWVRWQTTDRSRVRNPLAFLVTATTRLAINVLQSARARRETDAGPWLPEPVDTSADPAFRTERNEALNLAVLLLLEKLSPTERAVYVLREAFNYPYREIADILRVEEANARQLVARAREHVSGRRRAPVSPAEQRCLLNAFVAAARTGNLARLERRLTSDIASTSDGGGLVRAAAVSRWSRGRRQAHRCRRGTPPERRDSRVHELNGQLHLRRSDTSHRISLSGQ
jgi:RNA polymerase sigma factor (sigma-70 family)